MKRYLALAVFCAILSSAFCDNIGDDSDQASALGLYTIEGKVYPPEYLGVGVQNSGDNWQAGTVVSINGGEFKGFLREDGSFVISSVPSGSYVVEIHNHDYFYEPVSIFS